MKKQTKLGLVLAAAALISVSVASLVSARGWVQNGADWYYVDNDGEYVTETIQASGNTKFYLGEDGAMQKDYFLEDYNSSTYYFGSNGAMVTNTWVAIESDRTDNQGDYVPDNYWYYFQSSGKAVKGSNGSFKKTTIDGKKYMFNEYGQMCTGWIDENGNVIDPDTDEDGGPFTTAMYYAGGDNDGVLRSGWVTYYDGYNNSTEDYQDKTNLYFYFNTTNNKKYGGSSGETKKINGKTYAFDSTGIMLSGWDVNENAIAISGNKKVYFSGEDDGHQVKKGWVYAVPSTHIDSKAYGDGEEKYFYFGSSGEATVDQVKKVNGKYYVFNTNGIMQTGLVVWCPNPGSYTSNNKTLSYPHYINKFDMDWAEGSDVQKKGKIQTDDGIFIWVDKTGRVIRDDANAAGGLGGNHVNKKIKLQLFGEDGARKTGTNNVEFSDDVYTFVSNASGNKDSGSSNKKYYSMGIQLKASGDIKYGIYNNTTYSNAAPSGVATWYKPQQTKYTRMLSNGYYNVLNTSGSKQKEGSKKDADGNYWLISSTGALVNIYTVEVKEKSATTYKYKLVGNADEGRDDAAIWNSCSDDEDRLMTFFDLYYGINDTDITATNSDVTFSKTTGANNGDEISMTLTTGYYYKSEKGGKTNVMLPFGVTDDFGRAAVMTFNEQKADEQYQVIPNNDYFLNCYWAD